MSDFSEVIAENPKGKLTFANDALIIESKEQPGGQWDCPELCFHTNNPGAGKISWRKNTSGAWREHMMLLASQGDGFAFQMDLLGDGSDHADPDMKKLLMVHFNGTTYNVPILGASVPPSNGVPKKIRLKHSVSGKYLCGDMQFPNAPALFNRAGGGPWETFDVEVVE